MRLINVIMILFSLLVYSCTQTEQNQSKESAMTKSDTTAANNMVAKTLPDTTVFADSIVTSGNSLEKTRKAKITFIELGSVNCIPCKKMQPVMKAIEKKYGDQINVVFYDVWKNPAPGEKYNIELIPTQVFLDADDKEIMRHVGFFPESEIDAFLQKQGLTAISTGDKGSS